MSKLTDRVNYLKGMAAGMKLNMEKDANKLMLEMLQLMGEMAEEMQAMEEAQSELDNYVESIDEDLADLAETLLEGDEDSEDVDFDDAEDDEDDDEDDVDPDDLIVYACPHCDTEITFSVSDVDFDENFLCPSCGKPVFPELNEDD